MFRFASAFLLIEMLLATFQGVDLCCPEMQNSMAAIKFDNEILLDLVKDLRAKLGSSFEWPPFENDKCMLGFTYLPSAKRCYKVVHESHDWTSASKKCHQLGRGSHLAAVMNAEQNSALKTFLASDLSKNTGNAACIPSNIAHYGEMFWTSGQRVIENKCHSPFVWKPSSYEKLPVVFTSWGAGEPNCGGNQESCLHFWPQRDFSWNDVPCNTKMCPLCEYKP